MNQPADKLELDAALRAVARSLVARQLVRCAFTGVAGAAASLLVALLFADLLPRYLFSMTAGLALPLVVSVIGFAAGCALELRRRDLPGVAEAALALQSRLPTDSGALAAALRVRDDNVFYGPLMSRALAELRAAMNQPAPVLIPTSRMMLTPLLVLAGVVALSAAWLADAPPRDDVAIRDAAAPVAQWSSIDIAGSRSEADLRAVREAQGLRDAAGTLRQSAATLRDASASQDDKAAALRAANEALDSAAAAGVARDDLPIEAPADGTEAEALALKLDAAAEAIGRAAQRAEDGVKGSHDRGSDGGYGTTARTREFVSFEARFDVVASPSALATQTPARRGLAERALASLADAGRSDRGQD